MIKKFFKGLLALVVFLVVAGFGYQQYSSWQAKQDIAAREGTPQGQLPTNVSPTHYNLNLRITPDQGDFSGVVDIDIDISSATSVVWLHGKELTATSAFITPAGGEALEAEYLEVGRSGVVSLTTGSEIPVGKATIHIEFEGELASDLAGLYLVEEAGKSYAFTQFEATDARKSFPSFDEPRFKVPFSVALEVKSNEQGLANTPQINEEDLGDGYKRLTFAKSKPLPTYLIAFVVGDVDIVEYAAIPASDIRDFSIPLRGVAVKGKGEDLTYALENTASILNELEQYFGIPYPYEKLDIVAVPDFAAGAMENAGLITYREQLLLLKEPSLSQIRSYASVHAHELAHQWFGNLVTMYWWDDIWLNESFATWMASKAMIDWNADLGFDREMIRSGHGVMNQDLFADTRKIREPINSNGDIENAFDGITYQKGGAMLQMFEKYVTPELFRQGVSYHLQRFEFGHANADDFIESIMTVAQKPALKNAFNTFLEQQGVPLVKVQTQCDGNQLAIAFEQSRYLPLGAKSDANQQWNIPVCMTAISENGNSEICTLLVDQQSTMTVNVASCPIAVMPNAGGKGYYRWSLSTDNTQTLVDNMASLSAAEKYSLASNLGAEFRAGRIGAAEYINIVKPFAQLSDWDLVTAPVGDVEFIANNIATAEQEEQIKALLVDMYTPIATKLGMHPDTQMDIDSPSETKLLRSKILNLMTIILQDKDMLNTLAEMGSQYIGYGTDNQMHEDTVSSELAGLALISAVEVHGMPMFDALAVQLENTTDGTLRGRIITAMALSDDEAISEKVLDLAMSLSLRVNERLQIVGTHMSRKANQPRVYDWFKTYYPVISLVLPKKYIGYMPYIGSGFCEAELRDDLDMFFTPNLNDSDGGKRILSQVLERIDICIALVDSQAGMKL